MNILNNPVTHAQLSVALTPLRLGISASEVHGSLTGFLCGGGQTDALHWLDALELQPDTPIGPGATQDVLKRVYDECIGWFEDPELTFDPLLPPEAVELDTRSEALVDWCRGFLGGIGLAGVGSGNKLSAEANEILGDFATIAATAFENANAEEDENALVEVVEFLRVGVMLLHAELSHADFTPAPRTGETLH
jgi:uncharacterized protein YgfB (UPF0149 family)